MYHLNRLIGDPLCHLQVDPITPMAVFQWENKRVFSMFENLPLLRDEKDLLSLTCLLGVPQYGKLKEN